MSTTGGCAARALLSGPGVPADRVHQELFHADDEPPAPLAAARDDVTSAGPTSEVTVVLGGRTTTFSVPRHHTVLDGAQQVRPDLPFACKGGVCGTCRALVTQGRADMRRDYALEPAEVSADQTQHVPDDDPRATTAAHGSG